MPSRPALDPLPPAAGGAPALRLAHTGQLGPTELAAVRDLLAAVFDDLTEHDVQHCLGGVHALLHDGAGLAGHAAVVQRTLLHGGRALRTGYVEAVAVRPDARRRGHGAAVLAAVEQLGLRAYDLLALAATEDGAALYASRGWQRWRGPTSCLTPGGVQRTPDEDGSVWVLPAAAPVDLDGGLTCDWREGEPW